MPGGGAACQTGERTGFSDVLGTYIVNRLGCGGRPGKEPRSCNCSEEEDEVCKRHSPASDEDDVSTAGSTSDSDGSDSPRLGLPPKGPSFDALTAGATFAITQTAVSLLCGTIGAVVGGALAGPGGLAYGAIDGFTFGLAASGSVTPVSAAAATIAGTNNSAGVPEGYERSSKCSNGTESWSSMTSASTSASSTAW